MAQQPFRILSLSGGGVRGIFQAIYLAKLAEAAGSPLQNHFDLIAGTSTGAVIGLAVALNIDPARIVDFYKRDASEVFAPRFAAEVRTGPRYNQKPFRKALAEIFSNKRLADCRPPVLITAASLDRFRYRLFSTLGGPTESDGELLANEVALASAAAPTFFPPVNPTGQERSYVDGGLWANSPALVAVLAAHQQKQIPFPLMRVLSIGNGDFPQGIPPDEFATLRPLSFRTSRALFEIMFAAQESFADEYAMRLLPAGSFVRASTALKDHLPLDATQKALAELPTLAEAEFDRTKQTAIELITIPKAAPPVAASPLTRRRQHVSAELIEAAGLSGFYPSRAYYSHRDGASSIDRYIATARQSLVMVSINLMTGIPFDGMLDVLEKKLETRDPKFTATISLLNPLCEPVIRSVAPVLDLAPDELSRLTTQSATKLLRFRRALSGTAQGRLHLRLHDAVPFGSAIMLDHREPDGRIQIETKAYKAPVRKSFAFEVMRTAGEDELYGTLLSAYERLIEDGCDMDTIG